MMGADVIIAHAFSLPSREKASVQDFDRDVPDDRHEIQLLLHGTGD